MVAGMSHASMCVSNSTTATSSTASGERLAARGSWMAAAMTSATLRRRMRRGSRSPGFQGFAADSYSRHRGVGVDPGAIAAGTAALASTLAPLQLAPWRWRRPWCHCTAGGVQESTQQESKIPRPHAARMPRLAESRIPGQQDKYKKRPGIQESKGQGTQWSHFAQPCARPCTLSLP